MKHLLLIFFLLAALVSCTKQETGASRVQETEAETVDIEFTLDGGDVMNAQTKATTAAVESAIKNFQILVFNSNGMIDGYGKSSDGSKLSVKLTRGSGKQCYAVVNCSEDLSSVGTTSDLLSYQTSLSDNSHSGLLMIGNVEKDFSTSTSCAIPVTRFCAKVILDKVSVNFTSPAHQALPFTIKGIYLVNVNGVMDFEMGSTGDWKNPLKYVSGDCNTLISEYSLDRAVTPSSPMNTPRYFYCYANPTTEDTQGGTSFSARYTRLVVEATLGTQTYYYPINIVGTNNTLQSNYSYEITNLSITGLGSDSPDVVPKKGSVSFTVTVTDWKSGFSKQVEY